MSDLSEPSTVTQGPAPEPSKARRCATCNEPEGGSVYCGDHKGPDTYMAHTFPEPSTVEARCGHGLLRDKDGFAHHEAGRWNYCDRWDAIPDLDTVERAFGVKAGSPSFLPSTVDWVGEATTTMREDGTIDIHWYPPDARMTLITRELVESLVDNANALAAARADVDRLAQHAIDLATNVRRIGDERDALKAELEIVKAQLDCYRTTIEELRDARDRALMERSVSRGW